MRALVTGASGFIGRHVARALLSAGHDVTCLVRAGSDQRELSGMRLVHGDLGDAASLAAALEHADTVFHLASLLKVPWKPEFRTLNVGGTRALAEAAAARETPPVLVIVSSLAAAGPSGSLIAHTETDAPRPISIYGTMKLDCERAAAAHAARVPLTIVRPPMVFGEGDQWGLALFRSAARGLHVVPTWADARFSLVHVRDLADAIVAAGERGERLAGTGDPCGTGVYYVADDARPTYAELGRTVAAAAGASPPIVLHVPSLLSGLVAAVSELVARLRDRPTILHLDKWREASAGGFMCENTKAKTSLGFRPHALEARLSETAAWYRAQGWLAKLPA